MATQITNPIDVAQLQDALFEAQQTAFELLKCAVEQTKPSAAVLVDYGTLQQNADAAMLARLGV